MPIFIRIKYFLKYDKKWSQFKSLLLNDAILIVHILVFHHLYVFKARCSGRKQLLVTFYEIGSVESILNNFYYTSHHIIHIYYIPNWEIYLNFIIIIMLCSSSSFYKRRFKNYFRQVVCVIMIKNCHLVHSLRIFRWPFYCSGLTNNSKKIWIEILLNMFLIMSIVIVLFTFE